MGEFDVSPGSVFMTKVYDVTLTAAASALDTGATIPQGFNDLFIMWSVRGTAANTTSSLIWRFNNSSVGYYSEYNTVTGAAAWAGVQSDNASFGRLSSYPGASATASEFGVGTAIIPCYSFTDRHKSWFASGGVMFGTSTSTLTVVNNGSWQSNAAINQIQLLPSTLNFDVGSRLVIYAM